MIASTDPIRRIDWRFLLPDSRPGSVIPLCARDELLVEGLGMIDAAVRDADGSSTTSGDVVFLRDPDADMLQRAIALRDPDGAIVVETTSVIGRLGVRRRLRRAGLGVREYGCWPRSDRATRFVALDDRAQLLGSARASKNRRRRAIASTLAWTGIGSVVFRHATSVATGPGRPSRPAPLRVAFDGDHPGAGGTMTLLTPRFDSSRHVIAMVGDGSGRMRVVKSPRLPGDDGQLELEARGLSTISGPRPPRPELLADLDRFGQRWLVQTTVVGRPLSRRDVAHDGARWLDATQEWLALMPTIGRSCPRDDGREDRLLRPALDVLVRCAAGRSELQELVVDAERAIESVGPVRLPVRVEHGDFRPPNLIVTRSGGIAAVDWELADGCGLPLHDLAFFHAYVAETSPALAPDLRRRAVAALAEDGLDADLLAPLSTLASLRQAANLVSRSSDSLDDTVGRLVDSDVVRVWRSALHDRRPRRAADQP